jgi:hypothetical protein
MHVHILDHHRSFQVLRAGVGGETHTLEKQGISIRMEGYNTPSLMRNFIKHRSNSSTDEKNKHITDCNRRHLASDGRMR